MNSESRALWRNLEELADTPQFQDALHREFPQGAAELMYRLGCHALLDLSNWFRFHLPATPEATGDTELARAAGRGFSRVRSRESVQTTSQGTESLSFSLIPVSVSTLCLTK